VFQADEGGGVLRGAWSSAKAFVGRALGRTQTSGFRGAAFSAVDVQLDEEDDAGRPMLGGRHNRRF
jgi:hypothetical protein